METLTLGGKEYRPCRAKLKRWIELESLNPKIVDFSKHGRAMEFSDTILSYVSLSLGEDVSVLESLPWEEIIDAWALCQETNIPNPNFPIYAIRSNIKDKKVVWDYEGRTWYIWAHSLADAYGWSLEYIAELDVDDATALLEEIFVEEQLNREFTWMCSEIAYPYNEASKKGEFRPLPRPPWMMEEINILRNIDRLTHVKIRKDHMPVGNIIRQRRPDNVEP